MMRRLLAVAGLMLVLAGPVHAVNPSEILPDADLEARARTISAGLRCLVCQNQSIDDSDADLAHDLRVIVRERLTAGDSDDQVRQYLVDRYGEFVLLQPVVSGHTLLLWGTAPVLLAAGLGLILWRARRQKPVLAQALSVDEAAALAALDAEGDQPDRG